LQVFKTAEVIDRICKKKFLSQSPPDVKQTPATAMTPFAKTPGNTPPAGIFH
jgi:hypothetical protein